MRKILIAVVAVLGTMTAPEVFTDPAAQAAPRQVESAGLEPACEDPGPGRVRCHTLRKPQDNRVQPMAAEDLPDGLSPADLRSAYNITGNGTATVAVVAPYGYANAESDLATYRAKFGLPACTSASGCLRVVNQAGNSSPLPRANNAWAQEQALDVQMVASVCPTCKILLVQPNSDIVEDVMAGIVTAARLGATVISLSFGVQEDQGLTRFDSMLDIPGVAIVASTGDFGYQVNFPAASPHVIAVSGTTLVPAEGGRGWSETVWNGTGGGCSRYFKKPSWQTDEGCANRMVADVAAVGNPQTGVAVYGPSERGGSSWDVIGGTSASAPIIAGAIAVYGGPSNKAANLYSNSGQFFDVTSGSNGSCREHYLCNAGPGYDGPSGLGTPNGTSAFGGAPPPPPPAPPAPLPPVPDVPEPTQTTPEITETPPETQPTEDWIHSLS